MRIKNVVFKKEKKYMQKTLALVMVCKNEEKGLEKAILSCKHFVNEIVIAVDKSSSDKTLEIAKKYADVVKEFEWRDDFAWARNFAHEGVKSDWILFLDGHEYVAKCEKLEEALSFDGDGLLTTVRMESGAEFRNPRIYKNGVQFEGAVHEHQMCQKTALYPLFVVQHDRIEGQDKASADLRDKQRDDQLPRIMGERIKKDKKDINASFHLVLYYQSQKEYKKALEYSKLYLKYSVCDQERWYIYFSRALCYLALHRQIKAYQNIIKAESTMPNRWETLKTRGIILFELRNYEKAIECLVDSFKINEFDCAYKPWKRDEAGTWNLIGECYACLGNIEKCCVAFNTASDRAENYEQKRFFKQRAKIIMQMATGRKN